MTNISTLFCISLLFSFMELSVCEWKDIKDLVGPDHLLGAVFIKTYGKQVGLTAEELLPRVFLHSTYKFGYCPPHMIQRQFRRKLSNLTLTDWEASKAMYIYLLEPKYTQRFRMQCIIMKIWVARPFVFGKGRIPCMYCQGELRYVYLMTFQKIHLHEFYLGTYLNMPCSLTFEFYHADFLNRYADY